MVVIEVPIRPVRVRVLGADQEAFVFEGLWTAQENTSDGQSIKFTISNPLKEWALGDVGGTAAEEIVFRFVPVPHANPAGDTGSRDVTDDSNGRF